MTFDRIDTAGTPGRFVPSIQIDPKNPNHAVVSYSGYNAYDTVAGHVFDVTYAPASHDATFKDLSGNLGDEPITDVVLDDSTGDLYASTDFGVLRLAKGKTTWQQAAGGLPVTSVFGLTVVPEKHVLYAATHGRGVWRIKLPAPPEVSFTGPGTIEAGQPAPFDGRASSAFDDSQLTYAWRAPGGVTSSSAAPSLTSTALGAGAVTLTVTDRFGHSASASHAVKVVDTRAPAIAIDPVRGRSGIKLAVTAAVFEPGGIASATMSFSDGTPVRTVHVHDGAISLHHVFVNAGTPKVKVIATDRSGHTGTATATAHIGRGVPTLTSLGVRRSGPRLKVRLHLDRASKAVIHVRRGKKLVGARTLRRPLPGTRTFVLHVRRGSLKRGTKLTISVSAKNRFGRSVATKRFTA